MRPTGKKSGKRKININLFTWHIISTHLQYITGEGSPKWMLFTQIGHQYCRLYVVVANTYWIIDVFGFQNISTIAAFIKVLAWLMALLAKSYPCMPLWGLHWRREPIWQPLELIFNSSVNKSQTDRDPPITSAEMQARRSSGATFCW